MEYERKKAKMKKETKKVTNLLQKHIAFWKDGWYTNCILRLVHCLGECRKCNEKSLKIFEKLLVKVDISLYNTEVDENCLKFF